MPVLDTPAHRTVRGGSLVFPPPAPLARGVWVAALGDLSILVLLIWAIQTTPGGLTGVAGLAPAARLILIRVTAALAVAVCGTWLARTQPRLGGAFLMATALATSIVIPSVWWCIPATLLGAAGAMLAAGRPRFTITHVLAGGILVAVAAIPLSRSAVAISSAGDAPRLGLPPRVELALTPVAAQSSIRFGLGEARLASGTSIAIPVEFQADLPVDAIAFDLDYDPTVLDVTAIDVGRAFQDVATEHRLGVVSLPGVVGETTALTNAGVGLLTSDTVGTVGPARGTIAEISVRGLRPGATHLALRNVTLYSWVDGTRRHHQLDISPRPISVTVAP